MKNLSESIMKNLNESAKLSKNVNVRRIKESENLTARVTYHNEDGTRDYIAGKLSDGRYFLIGQQEQIVVSDKDLPRLAKKDMDDFRYDEDGDKEFIEALENGTTLDKNSDLAKIIINASRKYLEDGCYLLSESARRIKESKDLNTKSRRKAKKLNESSVLDAKSLSDILESDEVRYITDMCDNADLDAEELIFYYTKHLMDVDIEVAKKALSIWASDIRERMGDM